MLPPLPLAWKMIRTPTYLTNAPPPPCQTSINGSIKWMLKACFTILKAPARPFKKRGLVYQIFGMQDIHLIFFSMQALPYLHELRCTWQLCGQVCPCLTTHSKTSWIRPLLSTWVTWLLLESQFDLTIPKMELTDWSLSPKMELSDHSYFILLYLDSFVFSKVGVYRLIW